MPGQNNPYHVMPGHDSSVESDHRGPHPLLALMIMLVGLGGLGVVVAALDDWLIRHRLTSRRA